MKKGSLPPAPPSANPPNCNGTPMSQLVSQELHPPLLGVLRKVSWDEGCFKWKPGGKQELKLKKNDNNFVLKSWGNGALCQLTLFNRSSLTNEERNILAQQLYHEEGWKQREIADAIGESQPNVSKRLKKLRQGSANK